MLHASLPPFHPKTALALSSTTLLAALVACSAAADTGTLLHSTSSPASATAKAGETRLATVGDTVITAEDLAQRMRSYGDEPGRFSTAESRLRLLQDMVQHQVRVAAARAEGYEHKPEIVAALEGLMASAWERDHLTPKLDEIEVSSDEIAAHYENHAARLPPKPADALSCVWRCTGAT